MCDTVYCDNPGCDTEAVCEQERQDGTTLNLCYTCNEAFEMGQAEGDAAPDLLEALKGLFEHCVMVHKHWGEGSNARQADAAIKAAEAAIAKATR